MKYQPKYLLILAFLFVIAFASGYGVLRNAYRKSSLEVCNLIDENYYRSAEPQVQAWVENCRAQVSTESFLFNKDAHIARINARLSALDVSHLTLYSPSENKLIWENQGLDTGIRSRMIDGKLIVVRLLPASPAEQAGFKVGDWILKLGNHELASSFEAQTGSGKFKIFRLRPLAEKGKAATGSELHGVKQNSGYLTIEVKAEELAEDLAPRLQPLTNDVALLSIPSFLSQYFMEESWQAIARSLAKYKKIVIDLRGNAGGSFPAMVRAVSPFRCQKPLIGSLFHHTPRLAKSATLQNGNSEPGEAGTAGLGESAGDIRNDLDTRSQLEQLHAQSVVNLRAFPTYGCFDGPVIVLIDSETSSVSEIFAQAFFTRGHARILGQPSAGQVVMAQWFPIPDLGVEDYSLSIPIAGYRTAEGAQLENRGIDPEEVLNYNFESALKGQDSWIDAALQTQSL